MLTVIYVYKVILSIKSSKVVENKNTIKKSSYPKMKCPNHEYRFQLQTKIFQDVQETNVICILLLASRDVHFEKKNDMLFKWSIVKKHIRFKPQRRVYHLKDTVLLCDFC